MQAISRTKKALLFILVIFITGLCLPSAKLIPVINATSSDWNPDTFWYEPWGLSGVHKGVDIFAEKNTEVISPSHGLVLYTGEITQGGKVVIILAAKWRIHYFAHLNTINTQAGNYVLGEEKIGSVGDSGNAAGKQPHLHYSVLSLVPYVWRIDNSTQGWKKMFFLNPLDYF